MILMSTAMDGVGTSRSESDYYFDRYVSLGSWVNVGQGESGLSDSAGRVRSQQLLAIWRYGPWVIPLIRRPCFNVEAKIAGRFGHAPDQGTRVTLVDTKFSEWLVPNLPSFPIQWRHRHLAARKHRIGVPASFARISDCGATFAKRAAGKSCPECGYQAIELPAGSFGISATKHVPMLIVTTNEVQGFEIVEVHGDVFGLTVRARNYFSNLGASLRTVVGGEVVGYTRLLAESRNDARGVLCDAGPRWVVMQL